MDLDLVARIGPQQAQALSAVAWSRLVRRQRANPGFPYGWRSFNLIHIPTSQKVDIFPAIDAFQLLQLRRATRETVEFLGETGEYRWQARKTSYWPSSSGTAWVARFRSVSDRHRGDSRRGSRLDAAYLRTWAARLGVEDLLDKPLPS